VIGAATLLAATSSPAVVAEVDVNHHWLSVRRGRDDIDVASFSLSDLYVDHFGWLDGAR
jgi:hypothetical protein